MEIAKPTKGIKELCEHLGKEYSIKVIDLEQCIHRDLGNGYDIEISGVNNNRTIMNVTVYVWDIKNGNGPAAKIVETLSDIKSREELQNQLNAIALRYMEK